MQHHKPILYTREATCDSYFNISNNLDICISFFMSGKLQSSYKLGYCSASVLRVPNGRNVILSVSRRTMEYLSV